MQVYWKNGPTGQIAWLKLKWQKITSDASKRENDSSDFTFTFMHLEDAFIQSDLLWIQAILILSICVFPGNWTHNLCAANAML